MHCKRGVYRLKGDVTLKKPREEASLPEPISFQEPIQISASKKEVQESFQISGGKQENALQSLKKSLQDPG